MTIIRNVLRALGAFLIDVIRLPILLVFMVLRFLYGLLLFLLGRSWRKRPKHRCDDELPPHVRRKPDPCLYSQSYLIQQGIPVTWNNPDIWVTELDGTPVESSQLLASHPYQVHGRIWDASFDAALGVEVRCFYHDLGINGERIPVELSTDGTERVVVVNIAPWSSSMATFAWTTPSSGGHLCLRVRCDHVDDLNTANNVGQENMQILEGHAGSRVMTRAHLLNTARRRADVLLTVDTYRISEANWEFPIETRTRTIYSGVGRDASLTDRRLRGWLFGYKGRSPVNTRYAYTGREAVLTAQREADYAVPAGWTLSVDDRPIDVPLSLEAGESRDIEFAIDIPGGARSGDSVFFNLSAVDPSRGPLGGITTEVKIA